MRIGRLRARLRGSTLCCVEPKYYNDYASFKAFGEYLSAKIYPYDAKIYPYDGKAFLNWDWRWQNNKVWYGRSVNGMIPAASINYIPAMWKSEWGKETKKNEKDWCYLILFSYPYDNIIVNYTYSLEGAWIGWGGKWGDPHITVLGTTRLKVEFKAETREVFLPPGATILLSPITLMQKLGENISTEERERRLPPQVRKIFASAKTPLELAARLELESIRLREELEDKGEVMCR